MKPEFKGDGSGRAPRAVQRQIHQWLSEIWDVSPIKAVVGPPGIGKSFTARTIQRATGGAIITPSNILVDQYARDYPDVNMLKGKTHYSCDSGMSCLDWTNVLQQRACADCPYMKAKNAARADAPTIFNPMSLAYFNRQNPKKFPCIVVDEAHQLPGMLINLVSRKLRRSAYHFKDNITNELHLHRWLVDQAQKCYALADAYIKSQQMKEGLKAREDAECFTLLAECVQREPHNLAVWVSTETVGRKREDYLNIRPVTPPKFLVNNVLNTDNLILMSGTLFPHDVAALAGGDRVEWLDVPSPIPAKNREILYRPVPYKMNAETDPAKVVESIEKTIREFPNRNTIVHVSYSWSKKLAPLFTIPVIHNTSEDKDAQLAKFKREGGVFLAAGCAEGIDLRDDLCRLNIIPKLLFPDSTDQVVRKRKAMPDGDRWYDLETLKTTIQQAGRSTRHEKDWSTTVILDPNFSRLASKHSALLPESFYKSINWRGK